VAALAQPAPAAPGGTRTPSRRADGAARRRAVARRRIAIAVAAVVVLGVGGFLLFGGDDPIIEPPPILGGPEVEPFTFANVRTTVTPTSDTKPKKLGDVAGEASEQITPVLEELYMQAYVDPGAWGDYGDAWDLFADEAATQAESDVEVLTLGGSAGDLYEALQAGDSALRVIVLTDPKDKAVGAIAEVSFVATATLADGTTTEISSAGSYFLRRDGDDWRIVAYEVERDEEAAAGGTGATGAAATGGTGATGVTP
jgi:hypothetical protein